MAYMYTSSRDTSYYLHRRKTVGRNGHEQVIYFFAREVKDGALDEVPAGYEISESPRNGLPILRKVK